MQKPKSMLLLNLREVRHIKLSKEAQMKRHMDEGNQFFVALEDDSDDDAGGPSYPDSPHVDTKKMMEKPRDLASKPPPSSLQKDTSCVDSLQKSPELSCMQLMIHDPSASLSSGLNFHDSFVSAVEMSVSSLEESDASLIDMSRSLLGQDDSDNHDQGAAVLRSNRKPSEKKKKRKKSSKKEKKSSSKTSATPTATLKTSKE